MPYDPYKTFEDLVDSDKLDSLLGAARSQIEKNARLAGTDVETVEEQMSAFDSEVSAAKEAGIGAVAEIDQTLQSNDVTDAQKVAMVDLIVSTFSRLV